MFKSNDFIGSAELSLKPLFEDAIATQKPITLNKKYYEGFLKKELGLNLEFYDDDSFYLSTQDSTGKYVGKVRVGLNITPSELALANPVGHGRTEPNHSPFLPPPVGRISFSLNPFTMLVRFIRN